VPLRALGNRRLRHHRGRAGVSDEATLGVLDEITHPLAQLLYTFGSLIFGISLLRKGRLPKPAALLATVGPVAFFALFALGLNQSFTPIMAAVTAWAWAGRGSATRSSPSTRASLLHNPPYSKRGA
jgi:hypothetical protein